MWCAKSGLVPSEGEEKRDQSGGGEKRGRPPNDSLKTDLTRRHRKTPGILQNTRRGPRPKLLLLLWCEIGTPGRGLQPRICFNHAVVSIETDCHAR